MPIGAFARLARLTVKALRHYDTEGLLTPAVVDPHSTPERRPRRRAGHPPGGGPQGVRRRPLLGQRRRTVRCTLRIFEPAGIGPLGIAAAREPSAESRASIESICFVSMLRGSFIRWR